MNIENLLMTIEEKLEKLKTKALSWFNGNEGLIIKIHKPKNDNDGANGTIGSVGKGAIGVVFTNDD